MISNSRVFYLFFSCTCKAHALIRFPIKIFFLLYIAVLGISHLTFFLFESWYHFVGYIWIIIVLCSTLGLVAGIIVALSPHAVKQHVSPEEGEFALALITVGNGVGSFLAGLVGLFLEPYLTKRCKEHFPINQEFCMTRMPNSIGWKRNMGC